MIHFQPRNTHKCKLLTEIPIESQRLFDECQDFMLKEEDGEWVNQNANRNDDFDPIEDNVREISCGKSRWELVDEDENVEDP